MLNTISIKTNDQKMLDVNKNIIEKIPYLVNKINDGKNVVYLEDINEKTLRNIINYLNIISNSGLNKNDFKQSYLDNFDIEPLYDMILAANTLEIDELKNECEIYIKKLFTKSKRVVRAKLSGSGLVNIN